MVDYDKLDMAVFVSGYLEFCKVQPESLKAPLLNHFQLLMDRAITYSWHSLRNFHFSVNNAVEQGQLAWDSAKIICGLKPFFIHLALHSNSSPSRNKARNGTTPGNVAAQTLNKCSLQSSPQLSCVRLFQPCYATLICQHTTKSIVYILNGEGISVDIYIDDIYGTDVPSSAVSSFIWMNSFFDELGVLFSPEKDTLPCTQMLCLGVWIDTLAMTLSVPDFLLAINKDLIATDACLMGCGAVCFGKYFHMKLVPRGLSFVKVCTPSSWNCKLRGSTVFLSDNTTCVSVISSQHTSNPFMPHCL